jgi:hypothetical protein
MGSGGVAPPYLFIHCIEGWVCPRAGLDCVKEGESSSLAAQLLAVHIRESLSK